MAFIKSKITLLLFLVLLFSCVKEDEVDFSQIDNLKFDQQITGSLISFTATLSDFGDLNNLPFNGFDFNKPIDVFDNPTIQSELIKVNLHFVFDNTFDRNFGFTFNFSDTNNVIVFSTTIDVNKKATTTQDVLIEGLDIDQIKKSTKVDINVVVLNSNPSNTIDNTIGAFINFTLGASLDLSTGQQINAFLISLNASLPDFAQLDNFPFIPFIFDTPLDIFNITEIQNKLKKAEFHFEIENTFNRDFEVIFEFLDINNDVTYSISPIILDKTSNTIHDVVVEDADLENLKKSRQSRVKINVINSTTIDNTPGAFINLKSSASFFF